jgi:hypothetical protein
MFVELDADPGCLDAADRKTPTGWILLGQMLEMT